MNYLYTDVLSDWFPCVCLQQFLHKSLPLRFLLSSLQGSDNTQLKSHCLRCTTKTIGVFHAVLECYRAQQINNLTRVVWRLNRQITPPNKLAMGLEVHYK